VRSPANNDSQESHTIGVADEHIGAVVGRAGRNITEIIQVLYLQLNLGQKYLCGILVSVNQLCTKNCPRLLFSVYLTSLRFVDNAG
jgi:hypothetical protein